MDFIDLISFVIMILENPERPYDIEMAGEGIVAFGVWSVITVVILITISLVYRQRRQKNEPSSH